MCGRAQPETDAVRPKAVRLRTVTRETVRPQTIRSGTIRSAMRALRLRTDHKAVRDRSSATFGASDPEPVLSLGRRADRQHSRSAPETHCVGAGSSVVEHPTFNRVVVGSTPTRPTNRVLTKPVQAQHDPRSAVPAGAAICRPGRRDFRRARFAGLDIGVLGGGPADLQLFLLLTKIRFLTFPMCIQRF